MKLSPVVLAGILLCGVVGAAQQRPATDPAFDLKTLEAALAANSRGAEAERLADRIRSAFGGRDALLRGAAPKIDELNVAWALEIAETLPVNAVAPRVARDTGNANYPMVQVGTTGVYALVRTLSHGTAFTWHYEAGNRRFGGSQLEAWETHPDSREHAGVPKGVLKQMPPWESKIFNGTKRDWWIYVPAQYRAENPAAVMVFQEILQDGSNDLDNQSGSWWLANQTLARSLEFAGYDYRYDWGSGFHNYLHGRAIFPDSLRWLWRDSPRDSRAE